MSYAKSIDFLFNQMRNASVGSLSSGKLYFYAAGTTSPKAVYLDRDMTTQAANPYQLSADGTAKLFGDGLYRIVVKDVNLVTIYDYDNVVFQDLSTASAVSSVSERENFYRMTLDNIQYNKCHFDTISAAGTFTLSGSPLPTYNSLDCSYYGSVGSILTTPNVIYSGTYTQAYIYLQQDSIVNSTIEYSTDDGTTWVAVGADGYISTSFSSLKLRFTYGGSGKIYSYGLFYDYYGAYTVVPKGIYHSTSYTDLSTAITSIGTNVGTLLIDNAISVGSAPVTIPATLAVEVTKTGSINLNNNLTINGAFGAGSYQVFTGVNSCSFGAESIRFRDPVWFGTATITDSPLRIVGNGISVIDSIDGKEYRIITENGVLQTVEV